MGRRLGVFIWLGLFAVGVGGCVTAPPGEVSGLPTSEAPSLATITVKDLAGMWEYEEASSVYSLALDHEGKGSYEWKDGRFFTTSFSNGVWKGTWHQGENDREGGFELQLQPDLQTAIGEWWYTRIEEDQSPLQPGGDFLLRRLSPSLNGQESLK